jgi:tRNA G37 N-methylase Trm5
MTQEELDALTQSDDLDQALSTIDTQPDKSDSLIDEKQYEHAPPEPIDDNKVVYQLDDVTREGEEKAGEIFDQLDFIADSASNVSATIKNLNTTIENNIELFELLKNKFPNIDSFDNALKENLVMKDDSNIILNSANAIEDNTMNIIEIMQFQDIHRQKIERVINVMRSLSNYMNVLLEGQIDDSNRVSSAKHLIGDDDTDVVSNDDIEALIASFGN